jgi:hypothetical protein
MYEKKIAHHVYSDIDKSSFNNVCLMLCFSHCCECVCNECGTEEYFMTQLER